MAAREKAVVIGGGLAGLHAACRLARQGVQTVVVERRATTGGYCSGVELAGHRFDVGATMLHTPEVLTECFADLGRDIRNYLELVELDPLYEVSFPDGRSLLLRRGVDATAESIKQISARDGDNFRRYARDLSELAKALKRTFIDHNYPAAARCLTWRSAATLRRLTPWRSVEQLMRTYFSSSVVRDALSFQVYYLGAPPSRCPAVYGMIPYFEVTKGVWYVRGGLGQITKALEQVLIEEGGEVHTKREVDQILLAGRRVRGVRFLDGDELRASRVISNAEAVLTLDRLVPQRALGHFTRGRVTRCRPSCALLVTLIGVDTRKVNLRHHHTFYMPTDMAAVSRDLFELHQLPSEFCCYACFASLSDATLAPRGRGSLYVLTPAPCIGQKAWQSEREQLRRHAVDGLLSRGVKGLAHDDSPQVTLDPLYYEQEFSQPYGAGFGTRPSLSQIGPLRLGPRVAGISGLYLAGASTNPGAGIPLVLASGRSAAEAVSADIRR